MARGRQYGIVWQNPIASASKTSAGLTSTAAIRPELYEFNIGSSGTPADSAILWRIQRYTAAGTATAYVPTPLDPADPASTASAGVTHTVEPTYTAATILFSHALNQRASYRFIADPDGPLKLPATASNGVGIYPTHASSTVNTDGVLYFRE